MKICITSTGLTMDSPVDPRFGRCQYFLIVDEKGELTKSIPNEAGEAARGAGISAAQMVADEKVRVIITGNMGPNAYRVLNPTKVKIFAGVADISVKEAYTSYKNNELEESKSPQSSEDNPKLPPRHQHGSHGPHHEPHNPAVEE
ncbi:MAG: NifB/NifX family molybdenum-iron cluster-binding protein [Patescibacteria group bacterium]|nr:NifB/NifX family molybdenum-iron cluster-binding protein [Patescibacteria group bacterium]